MNRTLGYSGAIHDCWKRIGVEGNRSCRELVRYVHCQNCPVYSAAGQAMLDQPLSAEYRNERAMQYASARRVAQVARHSVIVFRIMKEHFALPTAVFQEIAEFRHTADGAGPTNAPSTLAARFHTLPHRRSRAGSGGSTRQVDNSARQAVGGLALGLINVRGELLVCASLARLLGLEDPAAEWLLRGRSRQNIRRPPAPEVREHPPETHMSTAPNRLVRLLVAGWPTGSARLQNTPGAKPGPGGELQRVAIPVDEVYGIHKVPQDEMHPPPATLSKASQAFTHRVFDCMLTSPGSYPVSGSSRTVGLLDAERVFTAMNQQLALPLTLA